MAIASIKILSIIHIENKIDNIYFAKKNFFSKFLQFSSIPSLSNKHSLTNNQHSISYIKML